MNPNAQPPPPPPPPEPTTTTAAEDVDEALSPTPQPKLTHSASTSSTASSQGGAGSDFEFTVSLSPASRLSQNNHFNSLFCPADELFFKGQLLPLSLPPRLHLLQSLTSPPLPPPTADWSSDATTTNSSSNSSSNSSRDSSRRSSSATEDINVDATHLTTLKKLRHFATARLKKPHHPPSPLHSCHQNAVNSSPKNSPMTKTSNRTKLSFGFLTKSKRMSKSAKQVIQKYMSKVKPLVDKISNHHHNHHCHLPKHTLDSTSSRSFEKARESCSSTNSAGFHCSFHHHQHSHSFSGNLRYPRKKPVANGYVAGSCPSSMRSSPSHSGVLGYASSSSSTMVDTSSMEELHSAILGAIAHCKNSIALQRKHHEKGSSSSSSSSPIFVG